MTIPTLETERLRMRGHRLEDLEHCVSLWSDPVVTRYTSGRPLTREEVWARLLRYIGHWTLLGYGFWVVEEKATGNFVGEVGVAEFERDMESPLDRPEAGWVLAGDAHGKGYATEAVLAAIAWGKTRFESPHLMCLIHPENLASIRIAGKCGFHELRRSNYKDHPVIVMGR